MPSQHVPKYGNYHGYYTKRLPFSSDPRLSVFERDFFAGKRVLDVGCNEGFVTCEIAQEWRAAQVVGVDIDRSLINMAAERRRLLWSLQAPALHTGNGTADEDVSMIEDDTSEPREGLANDYFPLSMPHMFGMLPLPNPRGPLSSGTRSFPHNVTFRHADWANDGLQEDAEGWDVIVAFSITKWIHLNGGDGGIRRFFARAYDTLRPKGVFVLEVQDWEGYHKAHRMDETLRENAKLLELRPDMFEKVLVEEVGFKSRGRLGVVGEGGFRRPIDLYVKPGT